MKDCFRRALGWLALGFFFLAALLPATGFMRAFYRKSEPFFSAPMRLTDRRLFLRNDSYGKGYFGASRNGGRRHQGIDILAPVGAMVLAPKSGRVSAAFEEKGYGKYIEILHPDGFFTRYAHLSELRVKTGDWVKKGEGIALCGHSGNANNFRILPHLHFEIRSASKALNPSAGYLDPALVIVNKNTKNNNP